MRNINVILTSLLLFLCLTTFAQTQSDRFGTISGKLVDSETQDPVEYATVSVMSAKDSSIVTGNVSEGNGQFMITEVPYGKYYLNISFIGYKDVNSEEFSLEEDNSNFNLGKMSLGGDSETLQDIVIEGRKSAIETRLDKKIFNAGQDIASQSGDALELLRNVPSVAVDSDGNISLRGNSNVRILIDGRPSSFTISDLLRQMPASAIEKVEIITNPGAKYNPEGTAGILNIILKKEEAVGINGNINLGFSQATYSSYNFGGGLNWRTRNFNAYVNYSYSQGKRYSGGYRDKQLYEADSIARIYSEDDGFRSRNGHNLKVGMDHYLNSWNTLYWSASYRQANDPGERTIDYEFSNPEGKLIGTSTRKTDELDEDYNYNVNLGWKKKFLNPDQVLEIDLLYDFGDETEYETYTERNFTNDELQDSEFQKQDEIENEGLFIARADYVHPINDNITIEGGARYDFTDLDNLLNTFDSNNEGEDYILNDLLSNTFNYQEHTAAVYGSYGQEWDKFGMKIGLRYEYTDQSIISNQDEEPYYYSYNRLYPSVHLTHELNETNTFLLSMSRRINRPSPWRLNPFTDFSDPFNLRSGNPYLLPEDIYAAEFGYLKYFDKLTVNLTAYYKQINDVQQRFSDVNPQTGVTTFTYTNLGTNSEYGIEYIFNYNPFKWWTLTLSGNAYQSELSNIVSDNVSNRKAFRFSTRGNSQMTIWDGLNIQLSSRYRAPFNSPQGKIYSMYNINLGISKSFFDKKLNVALSVRDIFNTRRFRYELQSGPNVYEEMLRQWDSQSFGINISYSFGKRNKEDKGRNGSGDSDGMGGMEM